MNFAVYVPPQAASEKVPVLYWLSGNCKCMFATNFIAIGDCAEQFLEAFTKLLSFAFGPLGKTFKSDSLILGNVNRG